LTIINQIITPITTSISALYTLTVTLQNNPRQIQESSKQTIQSLNESIIQIVFTINHNGPSVQIRQIQDKYLLQSIVTNSLVRWNDAEFSIQFFLLNKIKSLEISFLFIILFRISDD
jgi:hypothetical protein